MASGGWSVGVGGENDVAVACRCRLWHGAKNDVAGGGVIELWGVY